MTDGASPRMQPAEERQMGMNIESCCTESSNKWAGETIKSDGGEAI